MSERCSNTSGSEQSSDSSSMTDSTLPNCRPSSTSAAESTRSGHAASASAASRTSDASTPASAAQPCTRGKRRVEASQGTAMGWPAVRMCCETWQMALWQAAAGSVAKTGRKRARKFSSRKTVPDFEPFLPSGTRAAAVRGAPRATRCPDARVRARLLIDDDGGARAAARGRARCHTCSPLPVSVSVRRRQSVLRCRSLTQPADLFCRSHGRVRGPQRLAGVGDWTAGLQPEQSRVGTHTEARVAQLTTRAAVGASV